jgi:protein-tyrosine-phosphatase
VDTSQTQPVKAKILLVCAANICRSPAAEILMRRSWLEHGVKTGFLVETDSAGARAMADMPRCTASAGYIQEEYKSTSKELPKTELADYDLILTMERKHRGPIVVETPKVRSRVFTLIEAAQLADFIVTAGLVLDAANGQLQAEEIEASTYDFDSVPPLPESYEERWGWFVGELDAWRGQVPLNPNIPDFGIVDIPDPHDYQEDVHKDSLSRVEQAVEIFVKAITEVMSR